MILKFEWDREKDAVNQMKHGISFGEAKMVFFDPKRVEIYDWVHSYTEDRWKVFGLGGWAVLMVSFTEKNGSIRIISARKATKIEEEEYFNGYSTNNSN
jgi:uncharacterized DUF497 family protein